MAIRTYSAKPKEITRDWYVIDAGSAPVGRLATLAATYLLGKHKPGYTAHIDMGDGIIVINAAKLKLTGNKLAGKQYYHHTGYPGGIKSASAGRVLSENPERIIIGAIKGMLPKNKLQPVRMAHLRVFTGEEHGMEAQKPQVLEVTSGR